MLDESEFIEINAEIRIFENILKEDGYKIINIDSNIICQKPKLMNYIDEMRKNVANILELELNQISIKAKTNEEMDSTGNGTAIVANAISMIDRN